MTNYVQRTNMGWFGEFVNVIHDSRCFLSTRKHLPYSMAPPSKLLEDGIETKVSSFAYRTSFSPVVLSCDTAIFEEDSRGKKRDVLHLFGCFFPYPMHKLSKITPDHAAQIYSEDMVSILAESNLKELQQGTVNDIFERYGWYVPYFSRMRVAFPLRKRTVIFVKPDKDKVNELNLFEIK